MDNRLHSGYSCVEAMALDLSTRQIGRVGLWTQSKTNKSLAALIGMAYRQPMIDRIHVVERRPSLPPGKGSRFPPWPFFVGEAMIRDRESSDTMGQRLQDPVDILAGARPWGSCSR